MGRRSRATGYRDCQPVDAEFLATLRAMQLLGNRIALVRQRAGYPTQSLFAEALGVSRGLVGQWESHKKPPGRDNLAKIARLCGISMEYLLGETTEMRRTISALTDQEVELVLAWRRLPSRARENVFDLVTEWGKRAQVSNKKHQPV
jgi:transcriptional regulator with XRE-family HTH domain